MRTYLALIRKDLKAYFDQPTGYVLLILFVGILSYTFFRGAFFVRGAFVTDEASLRPLFDILPFVLMIVVPAACMRLFAEELRDGTLELLLTHPIRTWTVLFAKFIAGLAFVTVAILLTVGIPLFLQFGGNLDAGGIVAQYIGAILLAASFVAIGMFTSAMTRNQIVVFILALFINVVLILIGLSGNLALPSSVAVLLQDISPLSHYANIARGVIDLRDFLYFAALISTFLCGTYLLVRGRTLSHHTALYRNLRLGVLGFLIASILVGWFGNDIGGRWDLTEDKRYTLSPATLDILDGLDDLLVINLYMSKDPPVQIATVTDDVEAFLADLDSKSDLIRLVRRFPGADPSKDELAAEAQLAGVQPQQFNIQTEDELQVKTGWLGITLSYTNQRRAIEFVDTVDGLEYRVAALTSSMVREERTTVGFLTGHGEHDRNSEMLFVTGQLREQYELVDVSADPTGLLDLTGIEILIVPGGIQPLSAPELDALDDFFARGGKAMFLVDTTQVDITTFSLGATQTNLPLWLNRYGIFVHDNVVLDLGSNQQLSFSAGGGSVLLPYPYWPKVPVAQSATHRRISGSVQSVVLPWPASVELSQETEAQLGVDRHIELMRTSPTGALRFDYGDVSPKRETAEYAVERGDLGDQLMAAAAEGTGTASGAAWRIIVVGDSDWITDAAIQFSESNIALSLNWIDWLAQDESLAPIRSKVIAQRPLRYESQGLKDLTQYANMVGVPLLIVLFGGWRFFIRRKTGMRVYKREQ
ncbi:MAG: hypothetical protein FJ312_03410 [SAR202 cluster bacterium]|nr:hypothetical protein [SAR202 cluster bacterium]